MRYCAVCVPLVMKNGNTATLNVRFMTTDHLKGPYERGIGPMMDEGGWTNKCMGSSAHEAMSRWEA